MFGLLVYFDALPVANELPLFESSSTFFSPILLHPFTESTRGIPPSTLVGKPRE